MDGLAHKVQLHQQHQHAGLDVVTVNVDGAESNAKALGVLKKLNIPLTNWAIEEGINADVQSKLSFEVLPTLNLYDRKGRLRHQWEAAPDEAELHDWIGRLLSE